MIAYSNIYKNAIVVVVYSIIDNGIHNRVAFYGNPISPTILRYIVIEYCGIVCSVKIDTAFHAAGDIRSIDEAMVGMLYKDAE